MIDFLRRRIAGAALVLAAACGDTVDPSTVDLTGTWQATPNSLGIATITLLLTETSSQLSATGTYTSSSVGLENGTIVATGLHVAAEINLTCDFIPETAAQFRQNFTGHVEDGDHYSLVFPGGSGDRVTFTRQ